MKYSKALKGLEALLGLLSKAHQISIILLIDLDKYYRLIVVIKSMVFEEEKKNVIILLLHIIASLKRIDKTETNKRKLDNKKNTQKKVK